MHALQISGQTAFYIDYDDVLDLDVLNGLAAFLGVPARLEKLVFRFKKQNPEPIEEKVANPAEMRQALATVDWFNQTHTPNFEPRRSCQSAAIYGRRNRAAVVHADQVRPRTADQEMAAGLWRGVEQS